MHRHECPKCLLVWTHDETCFGSDAAHKCPTPGCDGIQRYRYVGDRPADVIHDKRGTR